MCLLEIATWRKTERGMGRKMLTNISIALDSFFPQERVVSKMSLSWLCKPSSVAARRAFLVRVWSLSSGGKATVSVRAFGKFVAAPVWDRECHLAVHSIQKPTPPEKCLTLTTCFPANWKMSYRANKQGSKMIFSVFLHIMVLKHGSMSP